MSTDAGGGGGAGAAPRVDAGAGAAPRVDAGGEGRDVVELRGLRVLGRHGCLPEERQRDQPFEVDVDVELDLAAAGASDDLADTLDYGAAAEVVARLVATEPSALLERVATRIADALLADARVQAVTVAVRKLRPPVPVDLATAGVRITRRRPAG